MGDLIPIPINERIKVFERDGQQWTTSLNIAEVFGKDHKHILDKVEKLECSQGFREPNFRLSNYVSLQGKSLPMYELTRDGFSFLVMGFTGKNAARFKEDYIRAFNLLLEERERNVQLTANHGVMLEQMHRENMAHIEWQKEQTVALLAVTENLSGHIGGVRTDVADVKTEVAVLRKDVNELKQNKKRKAVSKKNQQLHLSFTAMEYTGKCPMCNAVQIVGPGSYKLDTLNFDHHRGRHENALDKTWPLCAGCNNKKSNGGIPDDEAEVFFKAYQMRLVRWRKDNSPQQQNMFANRIPNTGVQSI